MKDFNARERRIISAAYRDAARICWEREWEARNGHNSGQGCHMAQMLAELMQVRAKQVLKYGAPLPRSSRGYHK